MDKLDIYREWITDLCMLTKTKTYVEIGIQSGTTFFMVAPYVEKAIGVDIVDGNWASLENTEFYVASTNEFFAEWKGKADLIFIDADHSAQQVVYDCYQAMLHLNDNGIVMLHDTWPADAAATAKELCGDAYKAVKQIRSWGITDIFTMPFMHGLTLVSLRPEWHR